MAQLEINSLPSLSEASATPVATGSSGLVLSLPVLDAPATTTPTALPLVTSLPELGSAQPLPALTGETKLQSPVSLVVTPSNTGSPAGLPALPTIGLSTGGEASLPVLPTLPTVSSAAGLPEQVTALPTLSLANVGGVSLPAGGLPAVSLPAVGLPTTNPTTVVLPSVSAPSALPAPGPLPTLPGMSSGLPVLTPSVAAPVSGLPGALPGIGALPALGALPGNASSALPSIGGMPQIGIASAVLPQISMPNMPLPGIGMPGLTTLPSASPATTAAGKEQGVPATLSPAGSSVNVTIRSYGAGFALVSEPYTFLDNFGQYLAANVKAKRNGSLNKYDGSGKEAGWIVSKKQEPATRQLVAQLLSGQVAPAPVEVKKRGGGGKAAATIPTVNASLLPTVNIPGLPSLGGANPLPVSSAPAGYQEIKIHVLRPEVGKTWQMVVEGNSYPAIIQAATPNASGVIDKAIIQLVGSPDQMGIQLVNYEWKIPTYQVAHTFKLA